MDPVPPVPPPPVPPPSASYATGAPPAAAVPTVRYAGFWLRWVAVLIDGLLLSLPLGVIYAIGLFGLGIAGDHNGPNPFQVLLFLCFVFFGFIANWLYFALLESSPNQATLGKRILGLKVTDEEGRRVSFGRASGRHWGKILSGIIFNIGYIMAAFTERKQALHDMLAKTLVVRR
jgi:uncharacterized RDD family membrane protein YckC